MNSYQEKWMEILQAANLPGWEFEAVGEDISVTMPNITDLKLIRDNLPAVIAQASLDIDIPHQPLKLFFKNGHEHFEYTITE